jgi:predicted Zn-ribbon and HTH transcriptional regulator
MKIGIVGMGKGLAVKKLIESMSKNNQNKCDDCRYEFNKDYESKCPLCDYEVKR